MWEDNSGFVTVLFLRCHPCLIPKSATYQGHIRDHFLGKGKRKVMTETHPVGLKITLFDPVPQLYM